jgi:ankyrin repeat protein
MRPYISVFALCTVITLFNTFGCKTALINHNLLMAVNSGNIEKAREALKKGANSNFRIGRERNTLLHQAVLRGNEEMIAILISNGAEINARNVDGWTPLHIAARFGNSAIAKLLLEKGADVRAQSLVALDRYPAGSTPLDIARIAGKGNIATLIRKYGGE